MSDLRDSDRMPPSAPRKACYTAEDLAGVPHLDTGPGEYPFLRGIHRTMYTERAWTIRQYAGYADATTSNLAYRRALAQGGTGLSVAFDLPTHRGYDSDHEDIAADVGMAGVAIDSADDMVRLFEGIALDRVSVSMTMSGAVLPVLAAYIVAAERTGVAPAQLRGTIQNDILKEFMVRNTYIFAPGPSMRIAADVVDYVATNMPQFNAMSISGYHLQEAGADGVLELALTLANAQTYVRALVARGANVDRVCRQLSFFFGVGRDFFGEIAKLRAARVLWATIARALGATDARATQLRMHCQTAGSTLSAQRPQNNIVRTTVEAMAAVFGGTQSLHTNGWDEALALPSEASGTVARDTQLILQHEMGLCDVVDPWAGAYMMESLTSQTVTAVQSLLAEIEAEGGVVAAIESGWVHDRVHWRATRLQAELDAGHSVVVGVNRYREASSCEQECLEVDGRHVRAQQVDRLRQLRLARDEARVREALHALTAVARTGQENLLALTVRAMRAGATVGECTAALELVWPRWKTPMRFSGSGRYAAGRADSSEWRSALAGVAQLTSEWGRAPRIAIIKLGQDGHDRGAKTIAAALSDAGFDVQLGTLFTTPGQMAEWVTAEAPDIVGISTLAGGHMTLVPAFLSALDAVGCDTPVVLGGIVPEAHAASLIAKGVDAIFGPSTGVDDIVVKLVACLRVRSAPLVTRS
ncbi:MULTISPECIES: methylmalonyl-CoA mutase [Pandoraea]|uniref:methylmalonyl-CoA mutase n=1 Tax=Pandoraea TaxID=93217 RepID=UPI001F5D8B7A|nr:MULTISPECIES: methylmalonyl-CoA mutase [Pandoraea]MCI3206374.1 methylmalonyl-CoA mutase [Pandoraea sp. LA3]MDN4584402.1 methylmalonyl-CoA mutase [Pandoraea capi]